MYRTRYGNLEKIASKTDGNCHLCHEPVDLELYGPTGAFGDETVTVDHLIPQSLGGDDHRSNLMIAHGRCNSIRGTKFADDVRLQLAGTSRAPMSSSDKDAIAFTAGGGLALLAGAAFAEQQADGTKRFNGEAAAAVALAALFLRALA